MDEWSGEVDEDQLGLIQGALESAIVGICKELKSMDTDG